MENTTYIKYIRTSPKKLRFLIDGIKKMKPTVALRTLFYSNKKSSKILYKTIKSAVNNAKRALKIDENLLEFKILTVEEGPAMKRSKAGGRGNVRIIKRRSSHVKIILHIKEGSPSVPVVEKTSKPVKEAEIVENTVTVSEKPKKVAKKTETLKIKKEKKGKK
jgi:large subunit ribosomal protein L22